MKSLFVTKIGNPMAKELGQVELRDIPMPYLGDEDVLIKVAYASICGSDAHVLRGNLGPLAAMVRSMLPMHLGHEVSGIVEQAGKTAAALGWKAGDLVTANYTKFCGSCYYCRTGRENFCLHPITHFDAMSQYICWHMSQIHRLPDGANLMTAALTEPVSIAMNAIETVHVHLGSRLAVFGGGGIGQMAVLLGKAAGASLVTMIEPVEEKRRLGISLGVDCALDPGKDDMEKRSQELTGGLLFDAVIEASGSSSAAETALKILSNDGHVVYFSMYNPDFNLPLNLFSQNYQAQKHIHGMYTSADIFPRVVSLMGRLNLEPIIQREYSLDDYEKAFADQLSGNFTKVVFKCN